jgi:hypothetical protein
MAQGAIVSPAMPPARSAQARVLGALLAEVPPSRLSLLMKLRRSFACRRAALG